MNNKPSLLGSEGLSFQKDRYPFWILALVLSAVVFVLYSVSLGHNFFFDEENIILNNPTIRSFHLIPEIFRHGYFYFPGRTAAQWDEYYRPLTSLTFMADYHFWGVNPLGYNLTNLALHLVLCVLYFRLLARLLDHRLAAFLAASLYAVHTIHTEAVTYTASRGDILGIALMLCAMLFYIPPTGRQAGHWALASLLCYFLALFSKETMILLPFYILALEIGYVKSRPKDLPKNVGPFFLVMFCFWLFRKFLCPVPFTPVDPDLRAMLLRVLGMGDGILQYFRALAAPEYFKPFSDVPELYGFGDPLIWTAVTVGALLLAAWFLSLRHRGLAFVGMTVFLIGLVPHFQIVRVYPKWAEHYICISCLGLFLLLGMLIRHILESRKKIIIILFITAYLLFFAFISLRTWQRNKTYNEPIRYYTLLSQANTPYRFFGYQRLALDALERGRPGLAAVYLNVALQQEFQSETNHELLGHSFLQQNKPQQALREFKLAYLYSGKNPHQLQLIGSTLTQLGRYREAAKMYLVMHRLAPDSVLSYTQLMSAYELLNQPEKVRQWFEEGLLNFKSKPEDQAALRMAWARDEYRRGNFESARHEMREILKIEKGAAGNADVARLCLGLISPDQFSVLIEQKHPYFKNSAPRLRLMAYVLQKNKAGVSVEFKNAHQVLAALAKKNPLIRREIRIARKILLS